MAHAEKRLIVSENLPRRPGRCSLLAQTRQDGEGLKMLTATGVMSEIFRSAGVQGETLHSASYRKESGLASVPPMHRQDQGILSGESAFRIMPRSLAVCSRCWQKINVPRVDRN